MHLALTDRLTCPSCPDFGLILLAHEVRERRVLEGDLGCSNCRETYPVRRGFADLRSSPRTEILPASDIEESEPSDPEEVLKLGALLGVTEGPGTLLIVGEAARFAAGISGLIEGVEVVGIDPVLIGDGEVDGVSRMVASSRIPFFPNTFKAILLSGNVQEGDLEEAARVVLPRGRVVVLDASEETTGWAEGSGLKVLFRQEGVLVAEYGKNRTLPLITLRGI